MPHEYEIEMHGAGRFARFIRDVIISRQKSGYKSELIVTIILNHCERAIVEEYPINFEDEE